MKWAAGVSCSYTDLSNFLWFNRTLTFHDFVDEVDCSGVPFDGEERLFALLLSLTSFVMIPEFFRYTLTSGLVGRSLLCTLFPCGRPSLPFNLRTVFISDCFSTISSGKENSGNGCFSRYSGSLDVTCLINSPMERYAYFACEIKRINEMLKNWRTKVVRPLRKRRRSKHDTCHQRPADEPKGRN